MMDVDYVSTIVLEKSTGQNLIIKIKDLGSLQQYIEKISEHPLACI